MAEISAWLKRQLDQRAWSSSELARRAGISQSSVSNVLTGKQVPGLAFCKGVAQALDHPLEELLRLAGHLPPMPAPVVEEQEALRLLRRLSAPMRDVALSLLRVLGRGSADEGVAGSAADAARRPHTFTERLAFEIAHDLERMPPDDRRRVLELMKRLRGDQGAGETEHVSLETDS